MTATILLIRHASTSHLGHILSGRTPGVELSAHGRAQASHLARLLAGVRLDRLQTSPVQRAGETAASVADLRPGLAVETVAGLDELDFGDWTGRAFAELADDPRWQAWNADRAAATCPGGESMVAAQARAWQHVERIAQACPDQTIAMVSHCDIIRALVAKVLDMTLDHIHRFEVGPASLTRVAIGSWGATLLSLNEASLNESSHA